MYVHLVKQFCQGAEESRHSMQGIIQEMQFLDVDWGTDGEAQIPLILIEHGHKSRLRNRVLFPLVFSTWVSGVLPC